MLNELRLLRLAKSKLTNLTSALVVSAPKAVAVSVARRLSLEFINATDEFIPRSFRTRLAARCKTLFAGRVSLDSVIHSDGWRGYNGLVDVGYSKHLRVNHSADVFAIGDVHINGIESYWSFAKRRLQKFNGVPSSKFSICT